MAKNKKRDVFGTSLGVIAATLGSAVGLGNIWKFPYMTGENGGAAFILVYLAATFIAGLPLMISEFIIGRRAGRAAVGAFKELAPGRPWYLTGIAGVVSSLLIMAFYTTVAGWVFAYAFFASTGKLQFSDASGAGNFFAGFTGALWAPLLWQWLALAVTGSIIIAGVRAGIERVTKTLLPLLFLLLIVCDIRALTLEGAGEGLRFLFMPDFSKITSATVLLALGLAFFKLSVSVGTMTTYGSYIGKRESLPGTALKVMFADIFVSLLAGMAIFPAVFSFGLKPEAGPPLLFFTLPLVFGAIPLGQLFLALFFILTSIAATGAMISLMEVPVAYLHEERGWGRKLATFASILAIALLGSGATLSYGVLQKFQPFGYNLFGLYDFLSSNLLMPITGIIIALFAGHVLGPAVLRDEATNRGRLKGGRFLKYYIITVRYLAPLAIAIVLLSGLKIIKL